jgi:nicotinamidase-related amidase
MQNDFIDGSLGSKEAQAIVQNVAKKIQDFDGKVILTKDTHFVKEDSIAPAYSDTLEGKLLPVSHCMIDANGEPTKGHDLNKEIEAAAQKRIDVRVVRKFTFGSLALVSEIANETPVSEIDSIELCGLCTDICVVSNALILRAAFPNTPMKVDSKCCAGVTPELHEAALKVMKSCQIEVI